MMGKEGIEIEKFGIRMFQSDFSQKKMFYVHQVMLYVQVLSINYLLLHI